MVTSTSVWAARGTARVAAEPLWAVTNTSSRVSANRRVFMDPSGQRIRLPSPGWTGQGRESSHDKSERPHSGSMNGTRHRGPSRVSRAGAERWGEGRPYRGPPLQRSSRAVPGFPGRRRALGGVGGHIGAPHSNGHRGPSRVSRAGAERWGEWEAPSRTKVPSFRITDIGASG